MEMNRSVQPRLDQPGLLKGSIAQFAAVLCGVLLGCSTAAQRSADSSEWGTRAARVTVGMTRAQVNGILPLWFGPNPAALLGQPVVSTLGAGSTEVYWVSDDWRVTVIYDRACGERSLSNRVMRSVRLENLRHGSN
jgi:hypothetical protein